MIHPPLPEDPVPPLLESARKEKYKISIVFKKLNLQNSIGEL